MALRSFPPSPRWKSDAPAALELATVLIGRQRKLRYLGKDGNMKIMSWKEVFKKQVQKQSLPPFQVEVWD